MSNRRAFPAFLASVFALLFFGLGNYLGARQTADGDVRLAELRAEVDFLRKRPVEATGTAGYVGNGYFITVKHGVIALGQDGLTEPRKIVSVKVMYKGRPLVAKVVDAGDAKVEVDPGDWAIVKVKEPIDLPALNVNLAYSFDFADPIFRLGNDYSKGIILSTGYVGQRTTGSLVTCLTDGHPGVSGGGVLNRTGELVGIPIGRMQGDYRFSFILPLRQEMFKKIPHLDS